MRHGENFEPEASPVGAEEGFATCMQGQLKGARCALGSPNGAYLVPAGPSGGGEYVS